MTCGQASILTDASSGRRSARTACNCASSFDWTRSGGSATTWCLRWLLTKRSLIAGRVVHGRVLRNRIGLGLGGEALACVLAVRDMAFGSVGADVCAAGVHAAGDVDVSVADDVIERHRRVAS